MAQQDTPADSPGAEAALPFPNVRVIGIGAPFRWLRLGFADFRACARSLYELSRRRELGLPGVLLPTLTVWRRNLGNIALFAGVLTVVFLIWARASMVIFAMFYTQEMPSLDGFLSQLLALENIDFLLVYVAVGAGFALFVFALSVVSIPLMLDKRSLAWASVSPSGL